VDRAWSGLRESARRAPDAGAPTCDGAPTGADAVRHFCETTTPALCQAVFSCCDDLSRQDWYGTVEACVTSATADCESELAVIAPLLDDGRTRYDCPQTLSCITALQVLARKNLAPMIRA
jgi:hypothetical protein